VELSVMSMVTHLPQGMVRRPLDVYEAPTAEYVSHGDCMGSLQLSCANETFIRDWRFRCGTMSGAAKNCIDSSLSEIVSFTSILWYKDWSSWEIEAKLGVITKATQKIKHNKLELGRAILRQLYQVNRLMLCYVVVYWMMEKVFLLLLSRDWARS